MKKLLATCAAIALAATSAVPLSAFAEDPAGDALVFSIKTNKTSYEVGDIAVVTVNLKSNPGINAWKLLVGYDDGFVPYGNSIKEFAKAFPSSGSLEEAHYETVDPVTGEKNTVTTMVNENQFQFSPFDGTAENKTTNPFGFFWYDYSAKKGDVLGPDCPENEKNDGYAYKYTGDVIRLYFQVTQKVSGPNHAFTVTVDPKVNATRGLDDDKANVPVSFENDGKVNVTVNVPEEKIAVDGITAPDSLEVAVGDTKAIGAAVTPANASNKKINYKSDSESIAVVDENGNVTGKADGSAIITCTTDDGNFEKKVTVTVKKVDVTGIDLTVDKTELYVGDTTTAKATVKPDNATNKDVKYTSSDPKVVEVDEKTGAIKAVGAGSATITATSAENEQIKAEKSVLVRAIKLTEEVNSKGEVEVIRGFNNSVKLEINAPNGVQPTITTTDEKVQAEYLAESKTLQVYVPSDAKDTSSVNVTLVYSGANDTDVTETLEIQLNVIAPQIDIVEEGPVTVPVDGNSQIHVSISPEKAAKAGLPVFFESSDESVATVDNNGNVKGIKKGEATITAKILGKGDVVLASDTVTVKVSKVEYKISFKEDEINIKSGSKKELNFVIDPANKENKQILADLIEAGWNFDSSDPAIADVDDETRMLKAYRQGTVVITATNPDYTDDEGNVVPVTCVVNVISVFPAATPVYPNPSTEAVGRDKVTGYVNAIVDTNSTAAGPIAATGGDMTDTETSNAPAIAAAALGVIALGFVVVARKKRRS